MTVRVLDYRGDGGYYLGDHALELEGLRDGAAGRVLAGVRGEPAAMVLRGLLGRPGLRHAYDVIVAAPKPVSVLLATESRAVARRVVALHERAVAAVHEFLLTEAVVGDRTACEARAVGFTHGVNRLLDPHLHTHVLVEGTGAGRPSGEGWALRRGARPADALYLAALREGLPAAAGRAAWVGRSGATHVEGVDLGLVAATTTPRARDGRVERDAPKQRPTKAAVRAHWAAQVGSRAELGCLEVPTAPPMAIDEYRFTKALGSGLVGRADVVRAWADACTFGERPERVRLAATLVAPEVEVRARRPAVVVADAVGVRVLGPRPRDPGALSGWQEGRAALGRYLGGGHALGHLADPRGASARTRLAIAQLEVELRARGLRVPRHLAVDRGGPGRGLS